MKDLLYGLRWDLLLVLVIGLSIFGYKSLSSPTPRTSESQMSDGSRPPDRAEGDILLLLPDAPAAAANGFEELDCSYGWFNALWSTQGAFSTALTRNLSPELLAGRSVVIVPTRVARSMPETGVRALENFVHNGGQILVERPSDRWVSLTETPISTRVRQARNVTNVEGLMLSGELRERILELDLFGPMTAVPAAEPYPSGPVLLEADDQPALQVVEVGKGRVFAAFWDLGCFFTGSRQGVPSEQMHFRAQAESHTTADRIARAEYAQSPTPASEAIQQVLFQSLSHHRPLPRLWPHPNGRAGTLMLGFPALASSRAALGFAEALSQEGSTSATVYVAADSLSEEELIRANELGAAIGWHWIRGNQRELVTVSTGIGGFRPFVRELSATEQNLALSTRLGDDRLLRLSHVEAAAFVPDWSSTFRQLAFARVRMDVSFGPSDPAQWGYLFGTGYPFYPLDDQGLPIPMLELPYQLHGSGITNQRISRLLRDSQALWHQALALNIPAESMRNDPSAGILFVTRDARELAAEHDHWLASHEEFFDFVQARWRSILTSQWNEEERRLIISVNLIGARVNTLEEGALPAVAFPARWDSQPVARVQLGDREVPRRQLVESGTGAELILTPGPGRHTIQVTYEKEPETEDDQSK